MFGTAGGAADDARFWILGGEVTVPVLLRGQNVQ